MTNPNYDPNAVPSEGAQESYTPDAEAPAQPAEVPATRESAPEPTPAPEKTRHPESGKVKGSLAASTWVALIMGFLLLILLIVFILQNMQEVELNFLTWTVHFPAGIAFLIFAIAGALIMALVGGWRMFELRRQVKRQAKLHS